MVHEMRDALGGEVRQDGHGHRAVGDDRQVGLRPVRGVSSAECDLVALDEPGLAERQMQRLDGRRHLPVRPRLSPEVAQRGRVPMGADGLGQFLEIVLHSAAPEKNRGQGLNRLSAIFMPSGNAPQKEQYCITGYIFVLFIKNVHYGAIRSFRDLRNGHREEGGKGGSGRGRDGDFGRLWKGEKER